MHKCCWVCNQSPQCSKTNWGIHFQARAYISIISFLPVSTTQCCASHQEPTQSRQKPTGSLLFFQKTSQTKSGGLPCHLSFLLLRGGWYPKDEEGRRTVACIKKSCNHSYPIESIFHLTDQESHTAGHSLSGTTGIYLTKLCFFSSIETKSQCNMLSPVVRCHFFWFCCLELQPLPSHKIPSKYCYFISNF